MKSNFTIYSGVPFAPPESLMLCLGLITLRPKSQTFTLYTLPVCLYYYCH